MVRYDWIPVERIQTAEGAERRRAFVVCNVIVSALMGQNHANIIYGCRNLGVVRVKKVTA